MKRSSSVMKVGIATIISYALTSLAGCSSEDIDRLTGRSKSKSSGAGSELISINLSLKPASNLSLAPGEFSLADATGFIMDVTGCASGYSIDDVTEAAGSSKTVKLYKTDIDCTAELQQFSFGGVDYTKVGGGNLTTGSATFEDALDPTDTFHVTLIDQLPSPLTDGATAQFVFKQVAAGADHAIADYSYTDTLEVKGIKAPNFTIADVTLDSIAADGKATFTFTTQCGRAVVDNAGDKGCEVDAGDNQPFVDMKVKLIYKDPLVYSSNTLTYDEAEAAMAAGTVDITNGHHDASTANEGFAVAVTGEGRLYEQKDMFFLISYTYAGLGTSYRYYVVTIGDPQ